MFDESRSGKTAYVEPFEVIECSDGLSTAKKALAFTLMPLHMYTFMHVLGT